MTEAESPARDVAIAVEVVTEGIRKAVMKVVGDTEGML